MGVLKNILENYAGVLEEPQRFKALLMDFFPEDRIKRNLYYISLQEQIPQEINSIEQVTNIEKQRWIRKLVDGYGCNVEIANEIIEQWIEALDCEKEVSHAEDDKSEKKMMGVAIADLELTPRTYNALKRAGINSASDLLNYGNKHMGVRNLGRRALEEILEKLKALGVEIGESNNEEIVNLGKEKCNKLREIRIKIARANGIDYEPIVCNHQGPCAGTCPACDEEIRYIDEALQEKRYRGEEINLVGIAEPEILEAGINVESENDITQGAVMFDDEDDSLPFD